MDMLDNGVILCRLAKAIECLAQESILTGHYKGVSRFKIDSYLIWEMYSCTFIGVVMLLFYIFYFNLKLRPLKF